MEDSFGCVSAQFLGAHKMQRRYYVGVLLLLGVSTWESLRENGLPEYY